MPEKLLNRTEICPALEQMRRERVPQRVRMRLAEGRRPPLARARPGAQPATHVGGAECAARSLKGTAAPAESRRYPPFRPVALGARGRGSARSPPARARRPARSASCRPCPRPARFPRQSRSRRPRRSPAPRLAGPMSRRARAERDREASSGVTAGIRSSSISISSCLSTRGSVFGRLGAVTRSAGFCATRPSCICTRKSARTAASLRATVLAACPCSESPAT